MLVAGVLLNTVHEASLPVATNVRVRVSDQTTFTFEYAQQALVCKVCARVPGNESKGNADPVQWVAMLGVAGRAGSQCSVHAATLPFPLHLPMWEQHTPVIAIAFQTHHRDTDAALELGPLRHPWVITSFSDFDATLWAAVLPVFFAAAKKPKYVRRVLALAFDHHWAVAPLKETATPRTATGHPEGDEEEEDPDQELLGGEDDEEVMAIAKAATAALQAKALAAASAGGGGGGGAAGNADSTLGKFSSAATSKRGRTSQGKGKASNAGAAASRQRKSKAAKTGGIAGRKSQTRRRQTKPRKVSFDDSDGGDEDEEDSDGDGEEGSDDDDNDEREHEGEDDDEDEDNEEENDEDEEENEDDDGEEGDGDGDDGEGDDGDGEGDDDEDEGEDDADNVDDDEDAEDDDDEEEEGDDDDEDGEDEGDDGGDDEEGGGGEDEDGGNVGQGTQRGSSKRTKRC